MTTKYQKDIARERIKILFEEAEKAAKIGKLNFANRYVEIARKVGMRCNVKIPRVLKRKFCKYCHSYLKPLLSCKIKINSKRKSIKIKCFNCNRVIRYLYNKKNK